MNLAAYRAIALIGGGGKTSISEALALHLPGRVALTTTTLVYPPTILPLVLNGGADEICAALATHGRIGVYTLGSEKYSTPPEAALRRLYECADHLILEADGARRLPFKIHRAHEPAVPAFADLVLCVAGIDALGRPLKEVCHRAEDIRPTLGKDPDDPATPEDAARLIARALRPFPQGVAVLNRCRDTRAASAVAALLSDTYGIHSLYIPYIEAQESRPAQIAAALL